MNTFTLTIREEHRVLVDGDMTSCSVTTPEGEIGFEAGHEDIVCMLAPHTIIKYSDPDGTERRISAAWGVFMFRENTCTITVAAEERFA